MVEHLFDVCYLIVIVLLLTTLAGCGSCGFWVVVLVTGG